MQREMLAILDAQVAAEVSGMDPVEERLNLSLLQRAEAYLKVLGEVQQKNTRPTTCACRGPGRCASRRA